MEFYLNHTQDVGYGPSGLPISNPASRCKPADVIPASATL